MSEGPHLFKIKYKNIEKRKNVRLLCGNVANNHPLPEMNVGKDKNDIIIRSNWIYTLF